MYLQVCAEGPNPLPVQGVERELNLATPQILQRPDVENQARDVPEYFADATAPEWVGPSQPIEQRSGAALTTDSGATSSDSSGS